MANLNRWIMHFQKHGLLLAGVDHFLAMFPATVLVPVIINTKFATSNLQENVVDIALVLFASGVGTLLFLLVSKNTPAYLGSSFAYIALSIYLIDKIQRASNITAMDAYFRLSWGYMFASIILLLLSYAYSFKKTADIITFVFPSAVIGPSISLIGLELSNEAAKHAGFNLPETSDIKLMTMTTALLTFAVIVFVSIKKRSWLKNSSIIVGVLLGCLFAYLNGLIKPIEFKPNYISIPSFHLPPMLPIEDIIQISLAVIPATIVIFAEHISRITVISRMHYFYNNGKESSDIKLNKTLCGHGLSVFVSGFVGSVPTTIYAENIAVMSVSCANKNKREAIKDNDRFVEYLGNPFNIVPYVVCAFLAISASVLSNVQVVLMNIPQPVIGGMELFLFGIIAAPGIQLLIDAGVNFRKLTNQILTGSVLIAGVSNFSFNFGVFELKGMSLGLVIGVSINLIFKIFDRMGILNERADFSETIEICICDKPKEKEISRLITIEGDLEKDIINDVPAINMLKIIGGNYLKNNDGEIVPNGDIVFNGLKYATKAVLSNSLNKKIYSCVELQNDGVCIFVIVSDKLANQWINDYGDVITRIESGKYRIAPNGLISRNELKGMICAAFDHSCTLENNL